MGEIIVHEGWKVLSDETKITYRLLMRNCTHLSMSGDLSFIRGPISDKIGLDGEGTGVDEMLQGTFDTEMEGWNGIVASSEMKTFVKVLHIHISATTGKQIPTIKTDMAVEDSCKIFGKLENQRHNPPQESTTEILTFISESYLYNYSFQDQ